MMLTRSVPCAHPPRLREPPRSAPLIREVRFLIGAAAFCVCGTFAVGVALLFVPRGESLAQLARGQVEHYATTAYRDWREQHPGETCPRSIKDLEKPRSPRDVVYDYFGTPLELFCVNDTIVVHGLGEDGTTNTADDLWSNR